MNTENRSYTPYPVRRQYLAVFLSAAVLLCLTLLCSACGFMETDDPTGPPDDGAWSLGEIRVVVGNADGVRVLSQNPCDVTLGGEASFDIEVEDGVDVVAVSDNARIEDGRLIVPEVYAPTTVRLTTVRHVECDFKFYSTDRRMGKVTATHDGGTYWSDTEITLTATTRSDDYVFVGYTVGKRLEEGGEIVSSSPVYSFSLASNVKFYANFALADKDPALTVTVPKDKWVLLYHSNGGTLSASGQSGIHTVNFDNTYYYCPNTLPNDGTFRRDGYVLLGYNTAPDGSGTYYAPGWNVIMPERGAISLYCVWAKETPKTCFKYDTIESGRAIEIEGYDGDEEMLVIPETIDGLPVKRLRTSAFANESFTSVFISRNVELVMPNAFRSCTKLETVYFSDSVLSVSDNSFTGCDNFSTLRMMATRLPGYCDARNGTFSIKYERLITAPGRKLVITSGSNSSFGINSEVLTEELKKGGMEVSVVNYGTHAYTPACFYIEVVSHHLKEGDILLHEPELTQQQWGYNLFKIDLWHIFESAYEAFGLVDIRHYRSVFSTYSDFAQKRVEKGKFFSYEVYSKDQVNRYGDYSQPRKGLTSGFKETVNQYIADGNEGPESFSSAISAIQKYRDELNRVLDMCADRGADVLLSFAVTLKIALEKSCQITDGAAQRAYEETVDEYVHATRISRVSTYLFEPEHFYNSLYHLNSEGAIVRSRVTAKDILAYYAQKER